MGRITETLLDDLYDAGVTFEDGLSTDELRDVEARFGFTFCADHRDLLTRVLPIGAGWPDWRFDEESDLGDQLARPIEGIVLDVLAGEFWRASWGPDVGDEAIARRRLADVPVLVPVYAHRYLPAGPAPQGSPVLSVYGTDAITYGVDLADYLTREFLGLASPVGTVAASKRIPFWSDLVDGVDPAPT